MNILNVWALSKICLVKVRHMPANEETTLPTFNTFNLISTGDLLYNPKHIYRDVCWLTVLQTCHKPT